MKTFREIVRAFLAAACLVGILQCLPAEQPPSQGSFDAQLVKANKAYDQRDYQTAATTYFQLLQQYPKCAERDALLADFAWSCLKLKKAGEATAALQALYTEFPNSPYGAEALPLLYQYCLTVTDARDARAVWQEAFAQWSDTPFIWGVVREHYKYLAQQSQLTPEALCAQFPDIFRLSVTKRILPTRYISRWCNANAFPKPSSCTTAC